MVRQKQRVKIKDRYIKERVERERRRRGRNGHSPWDGSSWVSKLSPELIWPFAMMFRAHSWNRGLKARPRRFTGLPNAPSTRPRSVIWRRDRRMSVTAVGWTCW